MGTLYEQMVIVTTYDWGSNDRRELDQFISEHPDLFTKSGVLTNSTINYMMFWDGSKEGWSDSDRGDELRAEFIRLCKKLYMAEIYEINNHEMRENDPTLIHTYVRNRDS